MNELIIKSGSQSRAKYSLALAFCICCVVLLLLAAPQCAQAAAHLPTNPSLVVQFNSFNSNTFNYGLAQTLTHLATSSSRTQTWLNLTTTTAGTVLSLTSTVAVAGSRGSVNNREQALKGVIS